MSDFEKNTEIVIDVDTQEEETELSMLCDESIAAVGDIVKPENCTEDEAEEFAKKIMRAAASLKAVKIDRGKFLRTEIKKHAPEIDANLAVETNPIQAGVSPQVLDQIACAAIDFETKKCASLSFLAGLPGGVALAAAVPADLTQYFAHVMRVEQKLAYLYGWESFLNDEDEVDDETVMELVVLMGVMMGVGSAANSITKFAANVAQKGVAKTIQRQALTKTTFYPIMKSVLRVLGVNLTKQTFAKTVSKVVPVIGGAVSGALTYATFKPNAEKLRKYLRELPTSGISADELDGASAGFLEVAGDGVKEGAKVAGDALSGGAKAAGKFAKAAGGKLGGFLKR